MRIFVYSRLLLLTLTVGMVSAQGNSDQRPSAESAAAKLSERPPGGIAVLPGYVFSKRTGIDTEVGVIAKTRGPVITYEVGAFLGTLVPDPDSPDILWKRSIVVRGATVRVFMLKGGELRVGPPYGKFIAQNVKSNEDIADALLTALSLDPDVLLAERGIRK